MRARQLPSRGATAAHGPAGHARAPRHVVAMIFQEPMTSLNPTCTVGPQIDEACGCTPGSRRRVGGRGGRAAAAVGSPAPSAARAYPHELSGGMRSG